MLMKTKESLISLSFQIDQAAMLCLLEKFPWTFLRRMIQLFAIVLSESFLLPIFSVFLFLSLSLSQFSLLLQWHLSINSFF